MQTLQPDIVIPKAKAQNLNILKLEFEAMTRDTEGVSLLCVNLARTPISYVTSSHFPEPHNQPKAKPNTSRPEPSNTES